MASLLFSTMALKNFRSSVTVLKLQIKQQNLDTRKLELEPQARENTNLSLSTVCGNLDVIQDAKGELHKVMSAHVMTLMHLPANYK